MASDFWPTKLFLSSSKFQSVLVFLVNILSAMDIKKLKLINHLIANFPPFNNPIRINFSILGSRKENLPMDKLKKKL